MSPNFSQLPVHSWTLPLSYVTSVCKNHQWPCTACRWKSQVLSLVFRASLVLLHPVFLASLPGAPLGTLGSCHLEPSIVLTFLWISLFPLTSSLVPILYWAGSYSAFKVLTNIISYGKPSLMRPQQHLLLLGICVTLCTHLSCMWFCQLLMCPRSFRLETLESHCCVPVLCLVCSRPLGNEGRMNFSIQHWFLKNFFKTNHLYVEKNGNWLGSINIKAYVHTVPFVTNVSSNGFVLGKV